MRTFQEDQVDSGVKKDSIRKRLAPEDVDSNRYECFCSKQYLSYAALYSHVKNKHEDFFGKQRNFGSTHQVQIFDPVYGYRIRKLFKEEVRFHSQHNGQNSTQTPPIQMPIEEEPQAMQGGFQLNKQEEKKIFEIDQSQMLASKLKSLKELTKLQERKLILRNQKLTKMQLSVQYQKEIVERYENIIKVINIPPISTELFGSPNPTWN